MVIQKLNLEKELYLKNKELYLQHKKTQQLLYYVSEAVIVVDHKFKITLANKKAEIYFGKNQSIVGKKIDSILSLHDREEKEIPLIQFLKENQNITINTLKQKIDGKDFYFNLQTSVIENDIASEDNAKNEIEYIITLTDITHEKNIEISKDDFITVTSHELRTPMTIIKSYLWLINEGRAGEINEKQKEYLTKSLNATERMLNLINDMLSVSKIDQGRVGYKLEKIDIDHFIAETLGEFEVKAKECGNKLIFEHTNEEKLVLADKKRLKEVLYNLIGNSMKFTTNGKIKVVVTQTNTPFAENDTFVKISVIDTGKGIPKEDMDKLFKKFGKLEHSYEKMAENGGTGLGLYITRQLIEGMGGKISAKSDGPGKGSEFYFFLQKYLPE